MFPQEHPSQQQPAEPPMGKGHGRRSPPARRECLLPSLLCSPQGRGSLCPQNRSGLWCLCAPVAPGLGVMHSPHGSEACPPHCLIVKPIKGGCLFLLASSKGPGTSPASEGCLGAGGPVFQTYLLVPQCLYPRGHLLYHPLLAAHPLTCLC